MEDGSKLTVPGVSNASTLQLTLADACQRFQVRMPAGSLLGSKGDDAKLGSSLHANAARKSHGVPEASLFASIKSVP